VLQNDKGRAIEVLQELLKMQPQNAGAIQAMEMLNKTP
jgi:hypothetical protein